MRGIMDANNVSEYGWSSAAQKQSTKENLSKIIALLKQRSGNKILDLGCGNGSLTTLLFKEGFAVTGCDYDHAGIEIAKKAFPEVPFFQTDVYSDPAPELCGSFDAVLATEVVEHLYHPDKLFSYASKVLRPGGMVVFTCPYHGYLKNLIIALLGKWDFQHTSLLNGGHIKFWSKKTIAALFCRNGFTMTHFVGSGRRIPFLWKSMIVAGIRSADVIKES